MRDTIIALLLLLGIVLVVFLLAGGVTALGEIRL